MLDLGLTASDLAAYEEALLGSRPMRTRVYLLDRDEQLEAEITSPIRDGDVTVDETSDEHTRQADLTLVDPEQRIGFDPSAPNDYTLFFSKLLRIVREDYVPELGRWVACPVFTGPLEAFDRDGELVEVTAVGKEVFHLEPELVWENFHRNKGTKVTDAIRDLLELHGEESFDIPDLPNRLARPVDLARSGSIRQVKVKKTRKGKKKFSVQKDVEDEPWIVAKELARGIGYLLFYDGRGRSRMKTLHPDPTYTFRTGEDGNALTPPRISYDRAELRNVVEVIAEGRGKKIKTARVVAEPHPDHPLSPDSLAHNGKRRRLIERVESSSALTPAEADRLAKRTLGEKLEAAMELSFDGLPVPHLEEGDRATMVDGDRLQLLFRPKRFTIPLTASGTMPVGENRRTHLADARIQTRRFITRRRRRRRRRR